MFLHHLIVESRIDSIKPLLPLTLHFLPYLRQSTVKKQTKILGNHIKVLEFSNHKKIKQLVGRFILFPLYLSIRNKSMNQVYFIHLPLLNHTIFRQTRNLIPNITLHPFYTFPHIRFQHTFYNIPISIRKCLSNILKSLCLKTKFLNYHHLFFKSKRIFYQLRIQINVKTVLYTRLIHPDFMLIIESRGNYRPLTVVL